MVRGSSWARSERKRKRDRGRYTQMARISLWGGADETNKRYRVTGTPLDWTHKLVRARGGKLKKKKKKARPSEPSPERESRRMLYITTRS